MERVSCGRWWWCPSVQPSSRVCHEVYRPAHRLRSRDPSSFWRSRDDESNHDSHATTNPFRPVLLSLALRYTALTHTCSTHDGRTGCVTSQSVGTRRGGGWQLGVLLETVLDRAAAGGLCAALCSGFATGVVGALVIGGSVSVGALDGALHEVRNAMSPKDLVA